uniref:Odontogenic, ameloblast associated n=1 Tax=Tetraodon nigroviridis TaxID=99883 RepID=H3CYZ5_TETNG
MEFQTVILLLCLFKTSFTLPVQIGILASNSNEVLRLNGLTLAALGQTQASSVLPQLVLQPPEMLLNWNPQLAAPFNPQFFPNQASQLTPVLPPNGPELQPQEPNAANGPQLPLNPVQMFPQFQFPYGFPPLPRQQSFGYFVPPYGYPQQRNPAVLPPNGPPVGRATQRPQLPLQQSSQPKLQTQKKEPTTVPPNPRGDASGPRVDEGQSNFPFLFEP